MNTKGYAPISHTKIELRMVELIVLNIGLDTGVLDTKLFTVMVGIDWLTICLHP